MPDNNYREEFEKKYKKPVVEGLIVGFSGIDPQNKEDCGCNPDELTDEQLSIINGEIEKKFNELKILIDSGNIDPDTPEPEPIPTPEPAPATPSNHEELEGLQGGQDGEHYHLTLNERNKLANYPEYSNLADDINHEELDGLLGGNSSGHYHLTEAERQRVQNYPDYDNLIDNINHESLDGLQGGNSSGHYHLTEAERNRVRNYPDFSELEGDINHEELDGLLGGNSSGHYHLTQAEREKLQGYPSYTELVVGMVGEIDHEKLENLFGGDTDGHYHMTATEKQKLSLYPSYSNLSQAVNHEKLSNLQGGTANEHYHLTQAERDKVSEYPEYNELTGNLEHDSLAGLKGGQSGEYYHLTSAERTKLQGYPNYENLSISSNHEQLSGLMGGESSGHFHLTSTQFTRLNAIISMFYPDGAREPVIPEGITLYDPFGNLPLGTPPGWQIRTLPSGYAAHPYVDKMYAGYFPRKNYGEGLCVVLKSSTEDDEKSKYFMFTADLETWKQNAQLYGDAETGEITRYGLKPYLYSEYDCINDAADTRILLLCSSGSGTSQQYTYYAKQNMSSLSSSTGMIEAVKNFNTSGSGERHRVYFSHAAYCYSQLLKILLIFSQRKMEISNYSTGSLIRNTYDTMVYTKPLKQNPITTSGSVGIIGFTINYGCAAWSDTHQVFCCSGVDSSGVKKTATSSNGVDWTENTNVPDNLIDLTYREDLGCFLARGEATKLFYASADGITWQQVNNAPIPLETVAAVDYNPENGWYCAVGGTGKYAYFSKDLASWTPTTISNSDVTAGSVIYMPSTGLYVLMPTSGNYYYTFNPADWSDS